MIEDWNELRQRGLREARLFWAIGLIVAGTLLFLGNLGILSVRAVWSFWPIALIGLGATRLIRRTSAAGRFFGIALVLFGTLFLLINLNVLHLRTHDGSWPLSMLLITVGMGLLLKRLDTGGERNWGWGKRPAGNSLHSISDWAVLGSIKRRLDTVAFEGGEASCVFGSVEVDLRRARIAPPVQSVVIEANAFFGEVKVRVPEGWKVNVTGVGIMGSFEDKSIPPVTPDDAPVLIVTGLAICGSVQIED